LIAEQTAFVSVYKYQRSLYNHFLGNMIWAEFMCLRLGPFRFYRRSRSSSKDGRVLTSEVRLSSREFYGTHNNVLVEKAARNAE
jgi:hypothetical protein